MATTDPKGPLGPAERRAAWLFLALLGVFFLFAVVVTAVQTGLALVLAVFANGIAKGRGAARTALYFPSHRLLDGDDADLHLALPASRSGD